MQDLKRIKYSLRDEKQKCVGQHLRHWQ